MRVKINKVVEITGLRIRLLHFWINSEVVICNYWVNKSGKGGIRLFCKKDIENFILIGELWKIGISYKFIKKFLKMIHERKLIEIIHTLTLSSYFRSKSCWIILTDKTARILIGDSYEVKETVTFFISLKPMFNFWENEEGDQ